ncbi:ribose-phosphate diphosphokinase [Candidatus Mancarchaeum acidiphilum]|uniref:ribose-phosphate diphosphokinase n=1 Tax=Candidatus Mancarchaeum acidiphilum TaxID=1920749 RepID=UPI0030840851
MASKVMAQSIANSADMMAAIELHDEQTLSYVSKPFANLKIKNPIYNFFKGKSIDYVISPDDGGYSRSLDMANLLGRKAYYIDKKRMDANTVEMRLPEVEFEDKNILLLDDMISTGNTMVSAIDLISDKGAGSIYCCAIHGIFAGESDRRIKEKADGLVVTDTIQSEYSKLSVAEDVIAYLRSIGI